ncbi:MAG: GntR family transcriptional regulator [Xanthomonadales bacterium]|nr:HTH-type transcriptional repressor YvoA [Xanthomonadales bacterium]MCC6593334.1 GntR family transcriptional regulator [Xanthomonadales bacterium]MCE7930429.1 GntR family transcriptional regulator [Xanthomonadales bacterium PRO6]
MRLFNAEDRARLRPDQPTPLYHQLYVVVKRKIEGGELRQGALLPAEKEIAAWFGISRITVKRALDDLEAEGFVSRHRGRGTHVTWKYEPKVLRAPLDSMLESLATMGRETQVRLIEFARVIPPPQVADALRVPPDCQVERAVRLRLAEALPFAHYVSWTRQIGHGLDPELLKSSTSRLDLFRRLGVHLKEVDQVITAVAADTTLAQRLVVRVGEPLLQVIRIASDQHGQPIDYLVACYRPDRFQYHLKMSAEDVMVRGRR